MAKTHRGTLVTFEGTEGSGKSTLIRYLQAALEKQGISVVSTREPGGNAVSEKIRETVLSLTMNPWTEILLYEAARAENTAQCMIPALEKGSIVLCDRFTDSSLAYQSYARGLPWKKVQLLNQLATQGIEPDLVVFLDIDPKVGLLRAQDSNRFEEEGVEFQRKVRRGFLKARQENPKKWLTVKIHQQTPEQLTETVLKILFERLRMGNKTSGQKRRRSKP
jgi:dTMP kinase